MSDEPNLDLGLDYVGGITKPTASDVGRFAVVALDDYGSPNFSYLSPFELSGLQTFRALGAVGNGVTNDYTIVQNAITAGAGKTFDGSGLTYKINTPLNLVSNLTIQNATFDFSSVADGSTCLTANSTLGTAKSLTSDTPYGTRFVNVASTTGILAGDYVLIRSTKIWSGSGEVGEIVRVLSVNSGTQLTLETPTHSAYTVGSSATLQKLNLEVQNVTFRNVRFIGAGVGHSQKLFYATHCFNMRFEQCRSDGFDSLHYGFYGSVSCRMTKCYAREATLSSTSYGVYVERGSKDILVEGCTFSKFRNGVAVGGGGWVSRYVRMVGNHVDYCGDCGLAVYAMAQYCQIIGNTIMCNDAADWTGNHDGLMYRGADPTIVGNTIVRPNGLGMDIRSSVTGAEADLGANVCGNTIVEPGDIGIYFANQGQTQRSVAINNNNISGRGDVAGGTAAILVYAVSGAIFNFSCNGNTVANYQAGGIQLRGSSNVDGGANLYDGTCVGNAIQLKGNNNGDGILLLTCKRVVVADNEITLAELDRFALNVSSGVDCTITGNILNMPSGTSAYCLQITGTGSGHLIANNVGRLGVYGLTINNTNTSCTIGLNDWTSCAQPMSLGTGAGHKLAQFNEVSADKGNADFAILHYSEQTILYNTPLTVARAVSTPTANVKRRTRIVRGAGATGAFNLNVGTGPLKALTAAGQWCEIEPDAAGSAYILVASGTL